MPPEVAGHADHVSALRGVDGDCIGRAVAAAIRTAQVEVDPGDVRAAEVADHDVVGTAERAELDLFDVVRDPSSRSLRRG